MFNSIKKLCDNSYKLGEIRITTTHNNANGLKTKNPLILWFWNAEKKLEGRSMNYPKIK
jgi:hypothetical protein